MLRGAIGDDVTRAFDVLDFYVVRLAFQNLMEESVALDFVQTTLVD